MFQNSALAYPVTKNSVPVMQSETTSRFCWAVILADLTEFNRYAVRTGNASMRVANTIW